MSKIRIFEDEWNLGRAGAEAFVSTAATALQSNPRFTVGLSGGNTPRLLYSLLASSPLRNALPWDKIHFFWGDERNVSPSSPESNFQMAWVTMLSYLPIPKKNVHRIRTELETPQLMALDYENTLRTYFSLVRPTDRPRFDLVLLGLGEDGHTASLFPDGEPGISISQDEPDRLVIAPWIRHLNDYRISLTPGALNQSGQILFLVSGSAKAEILSKVFKSDPSGASYPAQVIQPVKGDLTWLVEKRAATLLKGVRFESDRQTA